MNEITLAYDVIVHWHPFGRVGKAFVQELARLFAAYEDGSSLECIAVKAAMVLCVLFLQ